MENKSEKVLWRIVSKEAAFKADAIISPEYVEHTDYSQTNYARSYRAGQGRLVKKLPAFTVSKEAAFKDDAIIRPEYSDYWHYVRTNCARSYRAGQGRLVKKLPAFTM